MSIIISAKLLQCNGVYKGAPSYISCYHFRSAKLPPSCLMITFITTCSVDLSHSCYIIKAISVSCSEIWVSFLDFGRNLHNPSAFEDRQKECTASHSETVRGGKKKCFFFRKTSKGGGGVSPNPKFSYQKKLRFFWNFFLKGGGAPPIPKGCYHKKWGYWDIFAKKGAHTQSIGIL